MFPEVDKQENIDRKHTSKTLFPSLPWYKKTAILCHSFTFTVRPTVLRWLNIPSSVLHDVPSFFNTLLSLTLVFFYQDQIINRIKEAGFRIISRKDVGLTKELAGQFYHEHEGKDFFNGLTDYMSRYACVAGQSKILPTSDQRYANNI